MTGVLVKTAELVLLLALALLSDIKSYKIKNSITYAFTAAGLVTSLILGGLPALAANIAAAVLPAILLFALFALRMLGAGDIKLFCSIGAITGLPFILYSMACSFLAGGALALVIMAVRGNFKERAAYLFSYLKMSLMTFSLTPYTDFEKKEDGAKFRFSYAIASGTLLYMCYLLFMGQI